MIKLIKNIVKNQNKIRNFIAILLYKLKLLPKEFEGRVKSIYLTKKYNKEFESLKLKYDDLGFHRLNPMPSEDYLKKYYKDTYWQSRTDKDYPIRVRDIEHFKLLNEKFPEFSKSPKKILNFGAGHGGISFFLHAQNHEIYNYEPGGLKTFFNERWTNIKNLQETNLKFDLIYASHSLEHVHNINSTLKTFNDISNNDTIFFFEVPNCFSKQQIKIQPPHTYYFKRDFFFNNFKNFNFCKTFLNFKEQDDDSGNVIVFLSRSKFKNF